MVGGRAFYRDFAVFIVLCMSLGVLFGEAGCAEALNDDFDSESVINSSCPVAHDQRGSFMAKVASFPLHIRADEAFSDAERANVASAVAQWNAYGQQLRGEDFFELQFVALSSSYHAEDPRDCSKDGLGTADTFSIVREASAKRWRGLGFTDSIPGATLRCFSGKQVRRQVVMTYITVVDPAQFESVVLHELGHTLGLDHSCASGTGQGKFVSCSGLSDLHPYHLAVMFPSLRMRGAYYEPPEIKNELRDNDEVRTACLYGPNP